MTVWYHVIRVAPIVQLAIGYQAILTKNISITYQL